MDKPQAFPIPKLKCVQYCVYILACGIMALIVKATRGEKHGREEVYSLSTCDVKYRDKGQKVYDAARL